MPSNVEHQITHLDPVEEILPNGMAILSIPLGQDGFFISKEISTVKLCACGCGLPVGISGHSNKCIGQFRGQPNRFIKNHHLNLVNGKNGSESLGWRGGRSYTKSGIYIYQEDGYVLEHRLMAEKAIGKPLSCKSPVHHHTKNRHDNSSLVICQDYAYHKLLHRRTRAFEACGHANWRQCRYCRKYDELNHLIITGRKVYHQSCNTWHFRKYKKIDKPFLKAENLLCKPLPSTVRIYHYSESQFVICENQGYLNLLHQRERSFKTCGHAKWRSCKYCKEYDQIENMINRGNTGPFHRLCKNKYETNRHLKNRMVQSISSAEGKTLSGKDWPIRGYHEI